MNELVKITQLTGRLESASVQSAVVDKTTTPELIKPQLTGYGAYAHVEGLSVESYLKEKHNTY